MYPFASLPENLAAFCRVLNRDYAYRVGPRELQDAARALGVVPLGSERAVRDALRPVLGASREQAVVFDQAFDAFFHATDAGPGASDVRTTDREPPAAARASERRHLALDAAEPATRDEPAGDVSEVIDVEPGEDEEEDEEGARLRARYSPLEGASPAPELGPVDSSWRDAARTFVRRIEAGRSRRWRSAPRGPRFDLRRTLRTSLHTGGEVLLMRWRARPRRRPSFVLLVDGSRSMSTLVQPALQLAVALAGATSSLEVFAFSTTIRRVTPDVRLAAAGLQRRPPGLAQAWGGGTSIGLCLADFTRRFGERLLAPNTVVIVVSDGLDAGAPNVLAEVMARLSRLAASVIWLNPLVDTEGYEPTAVGMRAARPHVSTFTWVGNAEDLRRLARTVRVRSRA